QQALVQVQLVLQRVQPGRIGVPAQDGVRGVARQDLGGQEHDGGNDEQRDHADAQPARGERNQGVFVSRRDGLVGGGGGGGQASSPGTRAGTGGGGAVAGQADAATGRGRGSGRPGICHAGDPSSLPGAGPEPALPRPAAHGAGGG